MSRRHLIFCGWLAMISALLAIPWFLVVYLPEDRHTPTMRIVEGVMLFCGTAMFVFLMAKLRELLNSRHFFSIADRPIRLLIKGNVVLTAIGLLGLAIPFIESSVAIVTVILAIPLGIVQIVLGRILLSIPDDLHGLRNPYAYLTIATGFCQAIIFLMSIALFTGAVADVMLGTIFFQAARTCKTIVK